MARSFVEANEQDKQLQLFQEALTATAKILGENNEDYLSILYSVGQAQIDIDKKLTTFAECAKLAGKLFGKSQIAAFYLMRYADQAIFSNQADAAIVALKQAMESFGDLEPNDPRLAEAFMFLGRAHLELSDRQQATANLEKAIKIFRKDNTNITSQKSLARALVWLAGTFSDYRDYAGSIKHLEEAASIFEENDDPWTIDALASLAFSQSKLGLYSRAEATCQRATKFSQRIDRPDLNNEIQHMLGMIYQATGKLDEAEKLLKETSDFNIRVVGRENAVGYLHNYAEVLFDRGELNAAYAIHEGNYKIRKEKFGNHHNCTQSSLLALADISLLRHEYVDAKRYLLIALEAHSKRGRSDFEGG
jgi:tetratricopeptide (TPR) repeat protein